MITAATGLAFLIGVAVGAAGQYFADKYTDRRRFQEQSSADRKEFAQVEEQLTELFKEMRQDFLGPHGNLVRELVVLPLQGVIYNSDHQVFCYYADAHPNLRGQFAILENHGYVTEDLGHNVPVFRPSEQFVRMLLGEKS